MRTRMIVAAALAMLVTGGIATAARDAANKIVVPLKTQHNSGRSGTATLTMVNNRLVVVLTMSGKSRFAGRFELAHIHNVTCARYARMSTGRQLGTVSQGLTNVVRGKSRSELRSTLAGVADGTHSINVHEPNAYTVVACGTIPKA